MPKKTHINSTKYPDRHRRVLHKFKHNKAVVSERISSDINNQILYREAESMVM